MLQHLAPGHAEVDFEPLAKTLLALPHLQQHAPAIARAEADSIATKLGVDLGEIHQIVRQLTPGG